jgi:multidrug resistance protein, MATE family
MLTPQFKQKAKYEARQTLLISGPLVVSAVAGIGMEIIDTVMMGWMDKQVLAGGALVNALYIFLAAMTVGLLSSLGVSIASAVGAGKTKRIACLVNQATLIALCWSIPVMVLFWWCDDIFRMLGQPPEILIYTENYAHYFLWGIGAIYMFYVCREILAGLAKPRMIMLVSLAVLPLNALGNYVLMYGLWGFPAMGAKGIGLITALLSWLAFIVLFFHVRSHRRFSQYDIFQQWPRFDKRILIRLLKLGGPAAFSYGFESSLFAITAMLMGYFGTVALASHQIAIQCATLSFMVPYGISQGAAVRVGQAFGAENRQDILWATGMGLACGLLFAVITSTSFWLVPSVFVDIFLDLNDPSNRAVTEVAASFLAIAGLFQLVDCVQVVLFGALRGLRDTFVPMLICVFSYSVMGLGSGTLLAFMLGLSGRGLWFGLAIGLGFSSMLMAIRYRFVIKQMPCAKAVSS